MSAIGLTLAHLFDTPRTQTRRPDPALARRVLERKALEAWRQVKLDQVCETVRAKDQQIRRIDRSVELYPDKRNSDFVWYRLAAPYDTTTNLCVGSSCSTPTIPKTTHSSIGKCRG